MKIIVTTSNNYLHLIPAFTYLFNKYWSAEQEVEIVGYKEPKELPVNFSFHSLGEQGTVNEWSTDLRKYFAEQDDFFVWMMEDTLIKSFNEGDFMFAVGMTMEGVGRIDLTKDIQHRGHKVLPGGIIRANDDTNYRLSTQPSIWNKNYLLKYMTDGLTPWQFEKQFPDNEYQILGMKEFPLLHNEGVCKDNIWKLDLNGLANEDIEHINSLLKIQL